MNDFARDDITIRECIKPTPYTIPKPKPTAKPLVKQQPPITKPVLKKHRLNLCRQERILLLS